MYTKLVVIWIDAIIGEKIEILNLFLLLNLLILFWRRRKKLLLLLIFKTLCHCHFFICAAKIISYKNIKFDSFVLKYRIKMLLLYYSHNSEFFLMIFKGIVLIFVIRGIYFYFIQWYLYYKGNFFLLSNF